MKVGLIENIANANSIYISDLHHMQIQYKTLKYVQNCRGYGAEEWNHLIKYVFGSDCDFQEEGAARAYYVNLVIQCWSFASDHS